MLLVLFLLAGCGQPISNDIFADDADFLAVLPTEERNTVYFEKEIVDPELEGPAAPDLFTYTDRVSGTVNDFAYQVLEWVDVIRSYPPTERDEDTRRWGPWPVGQMLDYDLVVEIRREGLNAYAWEFATSPEDAQDWSTYLEGVHYPGETVAMGDGEFTADLDGISAVAGGDTHGFLSLTYNARDGIEFLADILGFQETSADAPQDALYWFRSDDARYGDFEFLTAEDIDGNGASEDIAVRSRWTPDLALRADARAEGGDLDEAIQLTQCWDASRALVYQVDSLGVFDPLGDLSSCPYADVALPEHVE